MAFTTKLDYSNNRQIKQHIETFTLLSGGTVFGVTFNDLPTGPNESTSAITETYTLVASTFSGNNTTTNFNWYHPLMELGQPQLSAITPSNSGETQTALPAYSATAFTTIDGNVAATEYTGSTFDVTVITMTDLGGGNYTGTIQTEELLILSAQTADFTGRTIWNDVKGISRTERLIVTNNPQVGAVLTCTDTEGMAEWALSTGTTGTTSFWSAGTGANAIVMVNSTNVASGDYAVAEGHETTASGLYAHAEGDNTTASGWRSHAEGSSTQAIGDFSHSQNDGTTASGDRSHAGGYASTASGPFSFVHGSGSTANGNATVVLGSGIIGNTDDTTYVDKLNVKTLYTGASVNNIGINAQGFLVVGTTGGGGTNYWSAGTGLDSISVINFNGIASGDYSIADGRNTTASGICSLAQNSGTTASGDASYAEGAFTIAGGDGAHAEGGYTTASGFFSHTEGYGSSATNEFCHAEGSGTVASGHTSHAEGSFTIAGGSDSHSQGFRTYAQGSYSHAGGFQSTATTDGSFVHGSGSTAGGLWSTAFGVRTRASGVFSHAEGIDTLASGAYSHAEGDSTSAITQTSHAEGVFTLASGSFAHAEGQNTVASGQASHAEGYLTVAGGANSHAEGTNTRALGLWSHSEGANTLASGPTSHAQGESTIAQGTSSHAGGTNTQALGNYSFVHGSASTASANYSHVFGRDITGSTADTTYVDFFNVKRVGSSPSVNDIRIDATGNLTTNTSDKRFKENITPVVGALDKIKALQGVQFQWKDRIAGGDDFKIGFIAQEVEEVEPLLVFTNKNDGYKGIHIDGVIPLLVEAVKELSIGVTTETNTYLETQTILAEDNNIELNFNGTAETSIGGGIKVLNTNNEEGFSDLTLNENGDWTTNTGFEPKAISIPFYTPTSSNDESGSIGNVTRNDDYLYIKTTNGWKRSSLESF